MSMLTRTRIRTGISDACADRNPVASGGVHVAIVSRPTRAGIVASPGPATRDRAADHDAPVPDRPYSPLPFWAS